MQQLNHPTKRWASGCSPTCGTSERPRTRGKFLFAGETKLFVCGATYGTFRPDRIWGNFPGSELVARDFAAMASNGINAIRTYTAPPVPVLDLARAYGLRVLVDLPWEQHVTFLDDPARRRQIMGRVREASRHVAGHPALLGYSIGNEIPAPIVRWHGRRPIVRFLRELYEEVKSEDPDALVTYVNYPTTEYLELPFLDFLSFNVYLERREELAAYLARLQNLASEKPLLMTEIGYDSRRHGFDAQASVLSWQIRTAFEAGCAGTFAFAWTDEWHRGGYDVEDWDFGLTTRDRQPKPALKAARNAYAAVPAALGSDCPRISVVICSYNGAETIRDALEATARLDYRNYEVILVDDGSTDATASIASEYDVRLIRTENQGLSAARNRGLRAATGSIIAYLDDDAFPDRDWLTYLAVAFAGSDAVGIGGPNLLPEADELVARCVYHAPGGPSHVLLGDFEAEHIPGCNMAFRKEALEAVGGFDPRFRTAGDDVDVCWRLREQGFTLGFHSAAMVWHHRRGSLAAYWRQQVGYGRAEAMLARKWPHRHNDLGHLSWSGRIYGPGLARGLLARSGRIYQGTWGSAPFQSVYAAPSGTLGSLPLMPEWLLLVALLAGTTALGNLWPTLAWAGVPLSLAVAALVIQALRSAAAVPLSGRRGMRALIGLLHVVQPGARLWGRLRGSFVPWALGDLATWAWPRRAVVAIWSEQWQAPGDWLARVEATLEQQGSCARRGGDWDRWDLEVRAGVFGRARTLLAVEEHGGGRQYLRFRLVPRYRRRLAATGLVGLAAGAALLDGAPAAAALLSVAALGLAALTLVESGIAMGWLRQALSAERERGVSVPTGASCTAGSP